MVASDLKTLDTSGVSAERLDDSVVFVVPRYKLSAALLILKDAGLVPRDAPLLYV